MAFFLLWQFKAILRDEIHQNRGKTTQLLEAFNLSSQAVKMTKRQPGVIYNLTHRNKSEKQGKKNVENETLYSGHRQRNRLS